MNESAGREDLSDDQKMEYAEFFQNCAVAKQTREIKQMLRDSARFRKELMEYFKDDFSRICNFYFAMPELVSWNSVIWILTYF